MATRKPVISYLENKQWPNLMFEAVCMHEVRFIDAVLSYFTKYC